MPELPPNSSLILYQTPDGQTRLECRFDQETLWLTRQMAELFQTSVPNVNIHLKAIYEEGELNEGATIKPYLIVRFEGTRQVSRQVLHRACRPSCRWATGSAVRGARNSASGPRIGYPSTW